MFTFRRDLVNDLGNNSGSDEEEKAEISTFRKELIQKRDCSTTLM
jgi:hypothetical protein